MSGVYTVEPGGESEYKASRSSGLRQTEQLTLVGTALISATIDLFSAIHSATIHLISIRAVTIAASHEDELQKYVTATVAVSFERDVQTGTYSATYTVVAASPYDASIKSRISDVWGSERGQSYCATAALYSKTRTVARRTLRA